MVSAAPTMSGSDSPEQQQLVACARSRARTSAAPSTNSARAQRVEQRRPEAVLHRVVGRDVEQTERGARLDQQDRARLSVP